MFNKYYYWFKIRKKFKIKLGFSLFFNDFTIRLIPFLFNYFIIYFNF